MQFNPYYNLLLVIFCTLVSINSFSQSQTFNSSGSFTVPTGVTKVSVEAWGGGGKGGTRTSDGYAGGGGGGAYVLKTLTSLTPGTAYTVTVGNGSTTTAAGGDSEFFRTSIPGTILARAKGGNSVANNNTNGGAGGLASSSIGDTKYSGGSGADGGSRFIFIFNISYGGGGGSSAGTASNGTNATNEIGATAPLGGGNGGDGGYSWLLGSGLAQSGVVPGGGGGGAYKSGGGTINGGNGANGRIVVCSFPITAGTITGSSTACQGQNTVSYSIPAISNATSYTWVYTGTGATISGTGNSITINFSNSATSGNLTVSGVNACGDGTASANYAITVNPLPTANYTYVVNPLNNGQVTFTNTSTNATSYLWDFGDSNTSTATNPVHTYATSGTYNVKLTSTNSCGSREITQTIAVGNTLGIDDELLSTFLVYPNPVISGEIKLNLPNEIEKFDVRISTILGQPLFTKSVKNEFNKVHIFDASNYKSGNYFITVSTENGKATKKLIIK